MSKHRVAVMLNQAAKAMYEHNTEETYPLISVVSEVADYFEGYATREEVKEMLEHTLETWEEL